MGELLILMDIMTVAGSVSNHCEQKSLYIPPVVKQQKSYHLVSISDLVT
jgi:hypothetical protein